MKKRILSALMAVCMLLGSAAALPQDAFSQSVSITASAETTSGDYKYDTLEDGTIVITEYTGKATTLTLPEKLDGKTVTAVGDFSFSENTTLKSVTVGGSITTIGYAAFRGCTSLTSVTLKSGVKKIDNYAFSDCTALSSISAPNTLEMVEPSAFVNTKWLTNQYNAGDNVILAGCLIECRSSGAVTLPNTVRIICPYAFNYSYVTSVTVPSSITKIYGFTFYRCSRLTSVSIPASVTSIEDCAFYNCSNLSNVTVASANKNYCTADGLLYDKNKTKILLCPVSKTSVSLPSTVKSIGKYAFMDCSKLTSVTLPNNLTSIGSYAFFRCTSLTSISLPDSVTEFGGYTFANNTSLKTVKLPSTLKRIENGLFSGCTALTSINIPDSVTAIGEAAFYDCTSLKNLTLSKNITSVGNYAIGYISGSNGYETIDPSFSFKCYKDTEAEQYGYTSGIKYILLDSTDPEGYPRSGAYKLDSAALLPFSATDRSYGIFGNDKNNGVYVLNNSKLYLISAANGKTTTVYDFSAASGDQLTTSYVSGSKLYTAGSHYDKTSRTYVYSIFVYDLDAKKLLSTLPYSSQVSAVGADTSGNIFVCANSKLSKLTSAGKLICETSMENAIYRFTGYDEKKGYLYYEGYYDYLYWGYHHDMTGLFAATVTSKDITVNNKCISMLYQNYFYDRNKSSDLLGGKYLVYNNNTVYCLDSNSLDLTAQTLTPMYTVPRPDIEDIEKDGKDIWSFGTRAAYCKLYDSLVIYTNNNTLKEYDSKGSTASEYNTLSHAFALCSVGENIVVIDQHETNSFYLEVIPWKHPTKVTMSTSAVSLKVSDTYQLTASTDSRLGDRFEWSSSDTKVASVNNEGKISATGVGTATITAKTQGGIKATCKVTVTDNSKLVYPDSKIKSSGAKSTNASYNDYDIWSSVNGSYLYEDSSKNLWRAEYIGSKITVEKYASDASKLLATYSVKPELPLFGGIYFSIDYNYVVTGQKNPNAKNDVEVLRITRYTKDWKKKDHVSVKGANTTTPFDAGSCRFTEINGKIYIHTCHEMYPDGGGTCHQANMTFILDKATMKVIQSQYEVYNLTTGYVSHSFNQFIANDGTCVYRADHAEGHNMMFNDQVLSTRGITVTVMNDGDELTNVGVFIPISANKFNETDDVHVNYTGIALGDFALSADTMLIAYTRDVGKDDSVRNVTVKSLAKNSDRREYLTRETSLTKFDSKSTVRAGTPQLVKVSDDLFAVLWEEQDTQKNTYCVKAMLIDGQGNKCSAEGKMNARLSDCEPILCSDGCIRWYVTNNSSPVFYSIQPFEIGTLHEHKYSKSEITKQPTCTKDGVRTYTCSVCGKTKTETIKATGHKWSEWTVTKQATETSKGTLTRKCSQCGKTETENYVYNSRLAGDNRFGTAAVISQTSYTTAKTVILANGMNYADALAGVPLANKLDAPILLTNTKSLDVSTADEIKRLKAEKVIILGGEGAVSADVEKSLQNMGLTTERIAGKTRFGTATAIAEKLNSEPTEVFFVYGLNYADALSVSPVAALKNAPIIYLTQDGELNADTAAYLEKIKGKVKTAYVIGGEGVISNDMMNKAASAVGLKTAARIWGANRYSTCIEVNKKFASTLTGKTMCVATGLNFPDALAGGVLAAKKAAPLFLTANSLSDEQTAYLKAKALNCIYVFGGTGAVSDDTVDKISRAAAAN